MLFVGWLVKANIGRSGGDQLSVSIEPLDQSGSYPQTGNMIGCPLTDVCRDWSFSCRYVVVPSAIG